MFFFGNVQPGGDDVAKHFAPVQQSWNIGQLYQMSKSRTFVTQRNSEIKIMRNWETEKRFAHHQGSSRTAKVRLEK
jgi:hypothetical protein